jgi:hypothetical protein
MPFDIDWRGTIKLGEGGGPGGGSSRMVNYDPSSGTGIEGRGDLRIQVLDWESGSTTDNREIPEKASWDCQSAHPLAILKWAEVDRRSRDLPGPDAE